ncbi:Integrase catalytic domain-containing protein (Fragment), partial [Durusdinium trenchii]
MSKVSAVAGRLNQEELESNYKGHKKFILGRIKKAIHAAQTEQKTYEALATKHRATHSKIDIMEIFAGSGTVSKTAVRYGLTATTPIDYNTGYDLSQPDSQVACDRMLQTLRPLFLLASIHRTPRLVMQENMNYNTRPELLEQLREEERPIVEKTMDWCKRQHSEGRFYLIENPNNSRLWEEPSVVAMLQETNGMVTTCHSGAYGATNSKGQKIKKTFKFASNNKDILYYLSEKLNAEELAQCIPLQGKEVTLSQHYPDGSRFRRPVELALFFYGYPDMIDENIGIPGEEAEQRQMEEEFAEPNPTREIFHEEITFPNTSGVDKSIKMATSRMHKNMGHLPPNEMIKLLALNGITSDQVIKCIKAMRCSACQRAKGLHWPNPATSTPQYLGQFADNVQADIFYLRDMTTENYSILGIICEATHLHTAIRLPSRRPRDVYESFRTAWLQHFGFPMRLSVDDDGAFKAEFDDRMTEGGTHLNVIAPEAHHQLGTIERHNGTLRMLLERIVDSTPCTCGEDIDNALIAATQAKNSATWSSGRPPYIAAFGRIPRFGTDLLSDPRALISGSTETQQQAALMRAEALKTLAEASASSTLRRALLRKTNEVDDYEPTPGSLLAYWRWTVRSHRKRGGYRIARFLGRDPDGRNYWVQSGSQTLRVARNQIRNVFGYEQYIPTRQDVDALKLAEENIRSDQIQDDFVPEEVDITPAEAAELEFQDA